MKQTSFYNLHKAFRERENKKLCRSAPSTNKLVSVVQTDDRLSCSRRLEQPRVRNQRSNLLISLFKSKIKTF